MLSSANVRNGGKEGGGIMYFVLAFNMSFVVSAYNIFFIQILSIQIKSLGIYLRKERRKRNTTLILWRKCLI